MSDAIIQVGGETIYVDLGGAPGLSAYDLWLIDGNAGSLDDFFAWMAAMAGVTVTALPGQAVTTKTAMGLIASPVADQVVLLTDPRIPGVWRFSSSNLSAAVAADPYQGLYVAPAAASTGASGAWVRQVPGAHYYAEWFLPAVMPADAELYLQSLLDNATVGSTIHLAPRQMTATNAVYVEKSYAEIIGYGYSCQIITATTNVQLFVVAASDNIIRNVWVEGTYGDSGVADAPGFHVYDAVDLRGGSLRRVTNVKFIDCGAVDCMTGFRPGYNTDYSSPTVVGDDVTAYGSADVTLERCIVIGALYRGIEAFYTNRLKIINCNVTMAAPPGGGYTSNLALRANTCQKLEIIGGHWSAASVTNTSGIVMDASDAKAPDSISVSRDTKISGLKMANFLNYFVCDSHAGTCEVDIECYGRDDADSYLLSANAGGFFGSAPSVKLVVEHLNFKAKARNIAHGFYIRGTHYNTELAINWHGNNHADAKFGFIEGVGTPEVTKLTLGDNRALGRAQQSSTNSIRIINSFAAGSEFAIGGNVRLTPDHAGNLANNSGYPNITTVTNGGGIAAITGDTAATAWATTTGYVVGNKVYQNGQNYTALTNHTSGTFATDLAAGKWGNTEWLENRAEFDEDIYD